MSHKQTTHLADYAPPAFLIDQVHLRFDLDRERSTVESTLHLRRNAQATSTLDLRLDGSPDAPGSGQLLSIMVDGQPLAATQYELTDDGDLLLKHVRDSFVLTTKKQLSPHKNHSLEGLYASGSGLFTQCEAEGFRKITWFLDRPDVQSIYTVTMRAARAHMPVLLSNGNLMNERSDGEFHEVTWHDPWRKPCYLFALVAANLEARSDEFVTRSGRHVALKVWVKPQDLDQTEHCMDSLKRSMTWDEQRFGREYDLDIFHIVAVGDFNMGAMENKSLNIFNTKYVLARPDTATDVDYAGVEAVVGHEYFHNWSGNRVTCRDWFQLSLKEGFTVFRDQEFSADVGSRAVKRIDDVRKLRSLQFVEDGGPNAHPVRPASYQEISNFYTLTIYEKGAEVVRMLHTMLGEDLFRRGCDLYFSRHDGQAATCDDFVRCMQEVSGMDLGQFQLWYSQAGTPQVHVRVEDDRATQTTTLVLSQSTPKTPGQPLKQAMVIPLKLAFLSRDGSRIPHIDDNHVAQNESLVLLKHTEQRVRLRVPGAQAPVLSMLRGFSAPVRLSVDETDEDRLVRLAADDDAFNRYEAAQVLMTAHLVNVVQCLQKGQAAPVVDAQLVHGCGRAIEDVLQRKVDPALVALLLMPPSLDVVVQHLPWADFHHAHVAREALITQLATSLRDRLLEVVADVDRQLQGKAYRFEGAQVAARSMRNASMAMLCRVDDNAALRHLQRATCMTDTQAALTWLAASNHEQRVPQLQAFFTKWQHEDLMIDKWFTMQAQSTRKDAFDDVNALLQHAAFRMETPNRVRALVGAFAAGNPVHFHDISGRGFSWLAERVMTLDAFNPQVAARMVIPLTHWRRQDPPRQAQMKEQLARVQQRPGVSPDVAELVGKALAAST
jgi:aminopeptidase N